ncbi:AAEL008356-PA [Aedes aegypti]|uniref:AAEL008356-PA n=1 Tax=Aedes aegypti TaxID=7159 RepID=Q0IEQ5_AEDAE|nr:AAEL008356-PA [Aedes aegypti]
MPSSQGYRKVASEPADSELEISRNASSNDTATMPNQQKSVAEPQTVVTGNPAGKIPATNSQQRLMPPDSDSVSSSIDEDQEATHGGGDGGGGGLRHLPPGHHDEDDGSVIVSSTGTGRVSRTAWFTVIVLCFVNLINYMDRFTIAGRWQGCLGAGNGLFYIMGDLMANEGTKRLH